MGKTGAATRRGALGVFGGSVAGALALGQAACGTVPGGGGGSGETAPSTAPARLRLIERLDQESQALDTRLPAFPRRFPRISVEREVVPGAELITKLQTMAASDTLPDNVPLVPG